MQLYLKVGFSLPAQASFFVICMGDSVEAGYRLHGITVCTSTPPPKEGGWVEIFKKGVNEKGGCSKKGGLEDGEINNNFLNGQNSR